MIVKPGVPKTLQDEKELAAFLEVVKRENVRSYLEIGSKHGGLFWHVGNVIEPGARMVTVDLPKGTREWPESEASLRGVINDMKHRGHETHTILGDSTDKKIIEKARALAPFDVVFIDANHTLPYVTKDFANYGPMGRIIAFHDIAWHRAPDWGHGTRIDVPEFWNSIKVDYRHEEFKFCPTGKNNGIGVLWRS